MNQTGKKGGERRTRRQQIGMAVTAGVAPPPSRGEFSQSMRLLRAALRLWEAKQEHLQSVRVWHRRFGPAKP